MDPQLPVVWLCGPPSVGKTSVAWQLYRRAAADGRTVAFVDVDQLGICYPERADDHGRHHLKEAAHAILAATNWPPRHQTSRGTKT